LQPADDRLSRSLPACLAPLALLDINLNRISKIHEKNLLGRSMLDEFITCCSTTAPPSRARKTL
jgi:hypothetical protein